MTNDVRRDPCTALPTELVFRVMESLGAADVLRAAQVSRGWNSVANTPAVWRSVLRGVVGPAFEGLHERYPKWWHQSKWDISMLSATTTPVFAW